MVPQPKQLADDVPSRLPDVQRNWSDSGSALCSSTLYKQPSLPPSSYKPVWDCRRSLPSQYIERIQDMPNYSKIVKAEYRHVSHVGCLLNGKTASTYAFSWDGSRTARNMAPCLSQEIGRAYEYRLTSTRLNQSTRRRSHWSEIKAT